MQGYVVLNRPWAFVQWLQQAHIEEEYVLFTISVPYFHNTLLIPKTLTLFLVIPYSYSLLISDPHI